MRWVWRMKAGMIKEDESGYVLIMSLFVLVIASLIGMALAVVGLNEFNLSARTKLMDQAYTAAEAGVNRAAVQLSTDTSLTSTTPDGTHEYEQAGDTPQWPVIGSADDPNSDGYNQGTFGNGTYKVQIWQSEISTPPEVPRTNPSYKVIKAIGTVSRGNKTAERIIETRVIAGNPSPDYDASFDYLIYNGMRNETPGTNGATWPSRADDTIITDWLGKWTYDGATPFNGHAPKGAIYTRGSVNLPAKLWSNVTISGHVVATDNITLNNSWNVGGITVNNGNLVAGIAPSAGNRGWVQINATVAGTGPLSVSGYVCAPLDVTITGTVNIGQAISLGGIVSGGKVTSTSTAGVGGQLQIGNVFCAKMVDIQNRFAGGTNFSLINCGRDATSGVGLNLKTMDLLSVPGSGQVTGGSVYTNGKLVADTLCVFPSAPGISITTIYAGTDFGGGNPNNLVGASIVARNSDVSFGTLYSRGRVDVTNGGAVPLVGNVWAGTDQSSQTGGTGISATVGGAGFSFGWLRAKGSINVSCGGVGGAWSWVWSGNNINITNTAVGVGVGSISAVGNIDLNFNVIVGGVGVGRISANGNATINMNGVGAIYIDALKSGGNVYTSVNGVGWMVFNAFSNSGWNAGAGNPGNTWSGYSVAGDAICAKGYIDMHSDAGWVTLLGDTFNLAALCDCGDAEAGSWVSTAWWHYEDDIHQNVGALQNWTPGVPDPGMPPVPNYTGGVPVVNGLSTADWLQKTPPMNLAGDPNNTNLMLRMAGLTSAVNMLEPNWTWFQGQAMADDVANPSVHHVISDGGYGDDDGSANGNIEFSWNNADPYSSNETVWVDIPNPASVPNLNITCDWSNPALPQDFTGTIVTKGPAFITDNPGVAWNVRGNQTLNVVAKGDITVTSGGAALTTSNNASFHFWSYGDINIQNRRFALIGTNGFKGSFTAGNKVIYQSNNIYENTTFSWSRWALDVRAWVQPFKVMTWREI